MAKRLEGKVAAITGGASGIGEATVRLFVKHGAKVVILDIQDERGRTIAQELDSDENVMFIHCDVTKESDVKNAIDTTITKFGKLDIMYNNAGISGDISGVNILNSSSEEYKRVFDVNVYGSFLGAKHAARVMIPANKGTILFTSSVASVLASGLLPHAYTMSKHAMVGMSKRLSAELAQYGIRVNCVAPYAIATPMMTTYLKMEEEEAENFFTSAANLKGVVLKTEDIAEAALYLVSDEAKYVSGVNLLVDGGYSVSKPINLPS
ncbi:SDR family oxidoreductase [Ralstonia pseudosolanacearum]|uniref:SDR family oxidoreductase n=1 Tax=Ralstonia pseudosolanacearum TaxID=1310165 RepID=UPI003CF74234